MKSSETELPGVYLLEPVVHDDSRGFFLESFNKRRLAELGIQAEFVQDNHSHSLRGVLRGLHFQRGQGKLITCLSGEIFDVAVDVRTSSPRFGAWYGVRLSGANHKQLWVPDGFAHGFYTLSEHAQVLYKTTDYWRPELEGGVVWNDPAIGIAWPVPAPPLLSDRDGKLPRLSEIVRQNLPA